VSNTLVKSEYILLRTGQAQVAADVDGAVERLVGAGDVVSVSVCPITIAPMGGYSETEGLVITVAFRTS
jgi:hypothetical protein